MSVVGTPVGPLLESPVGLMVGRRVEGLLVGCLVLGLNVGLRDGAVGLRDGA